MSDFHEIDDSTHSNVDYKHNSNHNSVSSNQQGEAYKFYYRKKQL
jgi:hypothetical protein